MNNLDANLVCHFKLIFTMLMEGNLDLKLPFTMAGVPKLYINLEDYFKLYLIMVDVDNLNISLGGYLRLSFIIAELITFL
jgi:hypothetical protein